MRARERKLAGSAVAGPALFARHTHTHTHTIVTDHTQTRTHVNTHTHTQWTQRLPNIATLDGEEVLSHQREEAQHIHNHQTCEPAAPPLPSTS